MNHTMHRRQFKRRPLVAMPGHALALAWQQQEHDRRDARAMRSYLGLRSSVTPEARRRLLAFSGGK